MKTTAAIPLSMYRKLVKNITMLQPHLYDSVFNKFGSGGNSKSSKNRIYIPLGMNKSVLDTPSATPNPSVLKYLEENNYKIDNYSLGTCIMPDGKRTTKIGKVLAKEPELLKLFVNDPSRRSAKAVSEGSLLCVISRHPYDILGISFDRGWTSCTNLSNGSNATNLKNSIKFGLLAAYLVKDDDKNINRPIARILIRPYFNENKTNVFLSMDRVEYGDANPLFRKTVSKFVDYCNNGLPKDIYVAPYDMYLDSEAETKTNIDTDNIHDILELIENLSDSDSAYGTGFISSLLNSPKVTEEILLICAENRNKNVRAAAMMNLRATEKVLMIGAKDADYYVYAAAARNPNATERVLITVVTHSKNDYLLEELINDKATEKLLLIGVKSDSVDVCIAAVRNPSATEKVLLIGAKNKNYYR